MRVASAGNRKLAWYPNINGTGVFSEQRTILTVGAIGHVRVADLDADGNVDVLVVDNESSNQRVRWLHNDGTGNLSTQTRVPIGTLELNILDQLHAADLDNDGNMDVIVGGRDIRWYRNDGTGGLCYGTRHHS